MSVMLRRQFVFFLMAFLLIAICISASVVKDIKSLKAEITEETLVVDAKKITVNETFNELTSLSKKINELKDSQIRSYSIIREIRIKYLLADAEEVESQYAIMNADQQRLSSKLNLKRKKLLALYRLHLKTLLAQMKQFPNKNTPQFIHILNQYMAFTNEKEALEKIILPDLSHSSSKPSVQVEFIESETDLKEKIDLLKDLKDKLKRKIKKINSDLRSMYERKQLEKQLAQFEDEIQFFSDEFMIANARPQRPTAPDSTNQDNDDDQSDDNSDTGDDTQDDASDDSGSGDTTDDTVNDDTDTSGDGDVSGDDVDTGVDTTTDDAVDDTGTDVDTGADDVLDDVSDSVDDSTVDDVLDSADDITGDDVVMDDIDDGSGSIVTETGSRDELLTPFKDDIDVSSKYEDARTDGQRVKILKNKKRLYEKELRQVTAQIKELEVKYNAYQRQR